MIGQKYQVINMLNLKYSDVPSLNLYSLLFKENGTAWASGSFTTFSSGNLLAGNHPINMFESRSGYYEANVSGSAIDINALLRVEVYQRIAASAVYGNDLLKATADIVWNKQRDLGSLQVPKIESKPFIGNFILGERLPINNYVRDSFGKYGSGVVLLGFSILNNAESPITNGTIAPRGLDDACIYNTGVTLSSASYSSGTYLLRTSGYYYDGLGPSILLQNESTFSIYVPTSIPSVDVAAQLGCASGKVNDSSATTTTFVTTLPSTLDNTYNGQVLRFTEGYLIGQGRIILDYVGATKAVTLNKPFVTDPVNNTSFIVYPLGGELGL